MQGRIIGREPFFGRVSLCEGPCSDKHTPRPVIIEPMFQTEAAGFRGDSERRLRLASELVEHREVIERKRYAEGVRDLPGQRKPFLCSLQGTVWIPEMPLAVAKVFAAEDAHIDAVDF